MLSQLLGMVLAVGIETLSFKEVHMPVQHLLRCGGLISFQFLK